MLRHTGNITKWQQISCILVATLLRLSSSQLACSPYDLQAQGSARRAECVDLLILNAGWEIRMAVVRYTSSHNGSQRMSTPAFLIVVLAQQQLNYWTVYTTRLSSSFTVPTRTQLPLQGY